jgi:hypothetical protein
MGSSKGLYKAEYDVGTAVKVKNREFLLEFARTWKFHNPLSAEQIERHGKRAKVKTVSFYHGGDELYTLVDIPGIWHEQCLESVEK